VTTDLVRDAAEQHGASPTVTAALGNALTGGVLLGALLKVQQRVALKLEGTGPVEKLLVESDSYGRVRGYAGVPEADLPFVKGLPDIVRLIGRAGLLTVNKDVRLKGVVEGVVPLATSDVAGDLTYYLNQSEQIPSLMELGTVVDETGEVVMAGGLLLQSLPPYRKDVITMLSDRIEELPPIANLLQDVEKPEKVLSLLAHGLSYVQIERRELHYECGCSRERSEAALIQLGREEIEALLVEEGQAVIDCHFCREQYTFDRRELADILANRL